MAEYMNARELFSLITPPGAGFVGAYVMFLTRTVPETLATDDLPIALEWAIRQCGKTAAWKISTRDHSLIYLYSCMGQSG